MGILSASCFIRFLKALVGAFNQAPNIVKFITKLRWQLYFLARTPSGAGSSSSSASTTVRLVLFVGLDPRPLSSSSPGSVYVCHLQKYEISSN